MTEKLKKCYFITFAEIAYNYKGMTWLVLANTGGENKKRESSVTLNK